MPARKRRLPVSASKGPSLKKRKTTLEVLPRSNHKKQDIDNMAFATPSAFSSQFPQSHEPRAGGSKELNVGALDRSSSTPEADLDSDSDLNHWSDKAFVDRVPALLSFFFIACWLTQLFVVHILER